MATVINITNLTARWGSWPWVAAAYFLPWLTYRDGIDWSRRRGNKVFVRVFIDIYTQSLNILGGLVHKIGNTYTHRHLILSDVPILIELNRVKLR